MEIHELVGDDNIYIFGEKSNEVAGTMKKGDYNAGEFAKRDATNPLVEFVKSNALLEVGNVLERLYNELTTKDWFITLLDLEDYIETKNVCIAISGNKTNGMQSGDKHRNGRLLLK